MLQERDYMRTERRKTNRRHVYTFTTKPLNSWIAPMIWLIAGIEIAAVLFLFLK